MDALDAARHWADGWAHAWRTHDAELVGSLYDDGVSFRSQPFRELDDPAGYARWAFEDEAVAECPVRRTDRDGRRRAAVEYWANSTAPDGAVETIAGVALLRFGTDGRVVDERDYWNVAHGRAEPYDGWGPVRP